VTLVTVEPSHAGNQSSFENGVDAPARHQSILEPRLPGAKVSYALMWDPGEDGSELKQAASSLTTSARKADHG